MSEQQRVAYGLVASEHWNTLIVPMLEQEYQITLESALTCKEMEELARNQGYAACLTWIRHEIETLSNEYKEANPDA